MRKSSLIIGLIAIALLSTACGKNMQLIAKASTSPAPVTKATSNAPVDNSSAPSSASSSTPPIAAGAMSGSLIPFSSYDMASLQSNLLYLDADDSDNSIRAVGSPAFLVNGESAKEGFVKSSNVVFRAIVPVPPKAELMKSVSKFKLILRGVRLYDDGSTKLEDVLSKQVLCLVEPGIQKCAGGKIDLSDKNINGAWKALQQVDANLADANGFKVKYTMENKAKVYSFVGVARPLAIVGSAGEIKPNRVKVNDKNLDTGGYSADLEIDLQKAFNISDKDLPQWILDNSTVYDTSGNYRKFRFELGNNIYAKEGELDLVVINSDSSTFIVNPAGPAENGDADVNKDTDFKNGIKVDDSALLGARVAAKKLDSSIIGFDSAEDKVSEKLNDTAISKLTTLAPLLIKDQDNLEEIRIGVKVDPGTDPMKSKALALARANLIKSELSALSVKTPIVVVGVVEKTSSCDAGAPTCEKDREVGIKLLATKTSTRDQVETLKSDLDLGLGMTQ